LKTCGFNGIGADGLAASASVTSVAFVIGLFIIPLAPETHGEVLPP
jgi:hypothetical protein